MEVAPSTSTEKVDTQNRKHHKFGPSRLNYLDKCAAFTSHAGTSEAAEEGTFLHDIMENMLIGVKKGKFKTTLEQMTGWVPKTYELTEDQLAYLRFACRRVDTFLAKKPSAILTEIVVRALHPDGSELNHGSLDVLFIFGRTGILIDFKFGWEPVTPAVSNLQGFNYVMGSFQAHPNLDQIGVEFIQPKLNSITSHLFKRAQVMELYRRIKGVIDNAEFVQAHPDKAQPLMQPGPYCTYCALQGECTVLANNRALAVQKSQELPFPVAVFSGLRLETPEDFAKARYCMEIIETGFEQLKAKAFETAKANGGSIGFTMPNGEEVTYEVSSRATPRVLGSAPEVAEALKDVVTEAEILGAAELAITKLEPIVKNAMVELAKERGEKLSKKAAWEQAASILEAHGVLSRPDTRIEFLQRKKNTTKQLEEGK